MRCRPVGTAPVSAQHRVDHFVAAAHAPPQPARAGWQAEQSFAESVAEAVLHAEWFDLRGRVFVLIGATSEMGPMAPLLACGATVVAIARPNSRSKPRKWQRVIEAARRSPGTLVLPLSAPQSPAASDDALAALAGADATSETAELIDWLSSEAIEGLRRKARQPLAIYSGIYLDGEGFVRASVAMDAIVDGYMARSKSKATLVYIDTPSHVHLVPQRHRETSRRLRGRAGPLLGCLGACGAAKPNIYVDCPDNTAYVVMDGLAETQGPNYAVAKMLQRWRGLVSRADGCIVSITNGPPARTDSVMHSKTMAFIMDNMHLVKPLAGHEPDTVTALMAIVLVRDLQSAGAAARPDAQLRHCMDVCSENAWHGGAWNAPYEMRGIGLYLYARHWGLRVLLPLLLIAVCVGALDVGGVF